VRSSAATAVEGAAVATPHRQQVACPMVSVVFEQVSLGECAALGLCHGFSGHTKSGRYLCSTFSTADSSLTGP
jgi:hypothetical protein